MSKQADRVRQSVGRVLMEIAPHPCLQVVAMSAEDARRFFSVPASTLVEDGGPPDRPERHKDGARCWNVWPKGKSADCSKLEIER